MIGLDCKNIRELFSEYYDGYKPGEVSLEEIDAHLDECEACAAAYEEYAQLLHDVGKLPMPEAPPGFHKNLMDYVNKNEINKNEANKNTKRPAKRKTPIFLKVAPLIAVAASLIFALVWVSGVLDQTPTGYVPLAPFGEGTISPANGEIPNARITPPNGGYQLPDPIMGQLDIEIDINYPQEEEPSRNNTTQAVIIIVIFAVCMGLVAILLGRLFSRKKNP